MSAFRSNPWLLSILSGLLMVISFPQTGSLFPLSFIAWVPLLFAEERFRAKKRSGGRVFLASYLAFVIYNIGTTWWIVYASIGGSMMAFFANSLLMALAFMLFHLIRKQLPERWSLIVFAAVWLTFEWLHFHWELSWPWLTFGNMFANVPSLVQWYSITGVFGGSLWVLLANALIYTQLKTSEGFQLKKWIPAFAVIVLPMALSLILGAMKDTSGTPFNVIVVQPNEDPYNEKFNGSNSGKLEELLRTATKLSNKNTQLIVAPETALYPNISSYNDWLIVDQLGHHTATRIIHDYQQEHAISVLIGGSTVQYFKEPNSSASNYIPQAGIYEESYNSSLLFEPKHAPEVIHKSKLVLGVEKVPFINSLPFLKEMAIDMGGGSGTLGTAKHPSVFKTKRFCFSPVVCYESIYGEFVAEQTAQNASFIAVITNDGWWDNTPGYKQHFLFSGLRAIENDRWLVRSANTGTSGIFNNKGEVLKRTDWWVKTAFNATIQQRHTTTIYQIIGDLIPEIACGGTIIFLLIALYLRIMKRRTQPQ